MRADLQSILGATQKFEYRELTDVIDLAGRLAASSSDPDVVSAATDVVNTASSSSFRLAYRNYSAPDGLDVDAATGLHIVFPSGEGEDVFDASGRRSLSEYQATYPNTPWGAFLDEWASVLATTPTLDLGEGQGLEVYEVWDAATVNAGGDVDFWL